MAKVRLTHHDALLIVDVQSDFLPGGRLAVRDGAAIVSVLNRYIAPAREKGVPVFASRDWHPARHCSFEAGGGPWPQHCVAGTPGAAFAPDLDLPDDAVIISKGTREYADAYSAFDGTDLAGQLRAAGVKRLLVGGLATDYCVRATVLDALREGFDVLLLQDAIRSVDVKPGDGERAIREMQDAGAATVRREDFAP